MKLIGKQIVVELPVKVNKFIGSNIDGVGCEYCEREVRQCNCWQIWNNAFSEVAKMNPALEIDVEKMYTIIMEEGGLMMDKIIALASNPSAWLKRKETDEYKNH